eukprot:SM000002S05793  [mRNA]  locus=s2:2228623:2232117:- [translate_table: standard]
MGMRANAAVMGMEREKLELELTLDEDGILQAPVPETSLGSKQLVTALWGITAALAILAASLMLGGDPSAAKGEALSALRCDKEPVIWAAMLFTLASISSCLLAVWHFANRAEQQTSKLLVELAKAREVAEGAVTAKKAFLSMVSHEIRTPLHGMIGMMNLLQEQAQLSAVEREYVDTALHSCWKLVNWLAHFVYSELGVSTTLPEAALDDDMLEGFGLHSPGLVRANDESRPLLDLGDVLGGLQAEAAAEAGGESSSRLSEPGSWATPAGSADGFMCYLQDGTSVGSDGDCACISSPAETAELTAVVHPVNEEVNLPMLSRLGSDPISEDCLSFRFQADGCSASGPTMMKTPAVGKDDVARSSNRADQGTGQGDGAGEGPALGQVSVTETEYMERWHGQWQEAEATGGESVGPAGGGSCSSLPRQHQGWAAEALQVLKMQHCGRGGFRADAAAASGGAQLAKAAALHIHTLLAELCVIADGRACGSTVTAALSLSCSAGLVDSRSTARLGLSTAAAALPQQQPPTQAVPRPVAAEADGHFYSQESMPPKMLEEAGGSAVTPLQSWPSCSSSVGATDEEAGSQTRRLECQQSTADHAGKATDDLYRRPQQADEVKRAECCAPTSDGPTAAQSLRKLDDEGFRRQDGSGGTDATVPAGPLRPAATMEAVAVLPCMGWPAVAAPPPSPRTTLVPPAPASPATPSSLDLLKGKCSLVVDDNPVNRKVLGRKLAGYGMAVSYAENGKKAVEQLLPGRHPFACVFMDLQMPVMDGYEATKEVRRMELEAAASAVNKCAAGAPDSAAVSPRVPIIAITADVVLGARETCAKIGMDGFLTKPLADDQLKQALAQISAH